MIYHKGGERMRSLELQGVLNRGSRVNAVTHFLSFVFQIDMFGQRRYNNSERDAEDYSRWTEQ